MVERTKTSAPELWESVTTVGPPLVVATTYLLACKQLVDVIGTGANGIIGLDQVLFWILLWLVGGSYLIAAGVIRGFRPQSRWRQLMSIGTSYLALIVIFAGFNYVLSAIGDMAHARAIAKQYAEWLAAGKPQQPPIPVDLRAFHGTESLWKAVDDYIPNTGPDGWKPNDYLAAFNAAAAVGQPVEPTFKPESRLATFLDCVHFSVVTMTTTGYGDISPNRRYAKLAADVQMLAGVSVVIFALGMAFGGWWRHDPLDELRERLRFGEIGLRDPFWRGSLQGLPSDDSAWTAQQESSPICPRCGSQNVRSFAQLLFAKPGKPTSQDPHNSTMLFLLILSVTTWLVYSLVVPRYLAGLSIVAQRVAAVLLIAAASVLIQMPLLLAARRIRRYLEPSRWANYVLASDRYSRSWSCEACRHIFSTGEP